MRELTSHDGPHPWRARRWNVPRAGPTGGARGRVLWGRRCWLVATCALLILAKSLSIVAGHGLLHQFQLVLEQAQALSQNGGLLKLSSNINKDTAYSTYPANQTISQASLIEMVVCFLGGRLQWLTSNFPTALLLSIQSTCPLVE